VARELSVHEVNPNALQQLAEQLAQNTMGMTALSATAVVLLHRRLRPDSRPSTASELFLDRPTDRVGASEMVESKISERQLQGGETERPNGR
jgi:hypothetical protein